MGKFKDFLYEEKIEYKIYVDMDGVLTDFLTAFKQIDGRTTKEVEKLGDKEFWKHVEKGGLDYWSNVPWMKDGKKLWNFVKKYNASILSAPARTIPESPKGKKIWVKRELGNVNLILKRARNKIEYAGKNTILIDDQKKNTDVWNKTGGIGIHHTTADKTIKTLKGILNG